MDDETDPVERLEQSLQQLAADGELDTDRVTFEPMEL